MDVEKRAMKRCAVKISSRSDEGWKTFAAEGALKATADGVRAEYRTDGDECAIELYDLGLKMERREELSLSARFSERERTELVTHAALHRGAVPVETRALRVSGGSGAWSVLLKYCLLFPENPAKFLLKIEITELK